MAKPRSLKNCTACCTQASQVSTQLGDQFRSGILKGMIDKLPNQMKDSINLAINKIPC